jgi:hypothetical protein
VYFYDNKINMGAMPIRKTWGDTCGQPTQVPGSQFQIRDGGASFYSQNNIFIHSGGSQNIYFREYVNPLSTTRFPNILVESKNNTYANTNFGTTPNPTTKPIARWDWQVVDQKYILNVGQWQNSLPSIYKPNAYDLLADGSTYIGDQTTINNLINQYFSGIP